MRIAHGILITVLALSICWEVPARKRDGDSGRYAYNGPRIDLSVPSRETHTYDMELIPIEGIGSYGKLVAQGFACWGDVGFVFYDTGYCKSIDLLSRKVIASFKLPAPVANVSNHAGQACFGDEFVSEGDKYPALYLSSYKENCCYVLRMTEISAELVQTIRITDGVRDSETEELRLVDAQAFFPDGENMVVKMGSAGHDGKKFKYWRVYSMPRLDMGREVFIDECKTSENFYVRTIKGKPDGEKHNFYNAGFARGGKIYVLAGFRGKDSRLLVIDYRKHEIVNDVHWEVKEMTGFEQEQCYPWGEKLLINYNKADQLVCIEFKN